MLPGIRASNEATSSSRAGRGARRAGERRLRRRHLRRRPVGPVARVGLRAARPKRLRGRPGAGQALAEQLRRLDRRGRAAGLRRLLRRRLAREQRRLRGRRRGRPRERDAAAALRPRGPDRAEAAPHGRVRARDGFRERGRAPRRPPRRRTERGLAGRRVVRPGPRRRRRHGLQAQVRRARRGLRPGPPGDLRRFIGRARRPPVPARQARPHGLPRRLPRRRRGRGEAQRALPVLHVRHAPVGAQNLLRGDDPREPARRRQQGPRGAAEEAPRGILRHRRVYGVRVGAGGHPHGGRGPASCGRDDFREISAGETIENRYRHAW